MEHYPRYFRYDIEDSILVMGRNYNFEPLYPKDSSKEILFSAILPTGLAIDNKTGVISGSPKYEIPITTQYEIFIQGEIVRSTSIYLTTLSKLVFLSRIEMPFRWWFSRYTRRKHSSK